LLTLRCSHKWQGIPHATNVAGVAVCVDIHHDASGSCACLYLQQQQHQASRQGQSSLLKFWQIPVPTSEQQ